MARRRILLWSDGFNDDSWWPP